MRTMVILSVFMLCMLSCTINDDNRCGDKMIFQNETCVSMDEDSNPEDVPDGGDDAGDISDSDGTPTGLGEPCDDSPDCDAYDADYCAKDPTKPGQKGVCSIANCTAAPNSCPPSSGLECCEFPAAANTPSLCMTPEQLKEVKKNYGITCQG